MFLNRKNDIDDNYEDKKDLSKYKLPLIILGGIILLVIIIFIIFKFINKNGIVYEDKLYYITLEGDNNITIYVGDKYNEPGYSGKDDEGNDLTSEIVVTNNIDTANIGNYKVSYTLGNVTKDRIVKVIEKPVGATKIYLYGDMNVFLYVGEEYIEKYYEVVDTVDGAKLKDKVTIKSNVDTSKEGIYKVIYSVVNSSGVTTTEERTVIVMDRELSLIPNTTDITNNNITINVYTKDEFFDYLILPNGNKTTERTTTYEVSSNGTYKFVAYNNKGESKEKSITISNIDKESPTASCSGYYQNGTSQINVSAKDNVGISRYEINGTSYTINTIKINSEIKTANVTIYDKAGNSKSISCNLENKNPTPAPSSSSSSYNSSSSSTVIVNKGTKNIIVGDSRTVGMCIAMTGDSYRCEYVNGGKTNGDDFYIAQTGAGYDWFSKTAISKIDAILKANPGVRYNIISLMGINHMVDEASKYEIKYNELAKNNWKDHNIILVSVNPVNEAIEATYGYHNKNSDIEKFNVKIKKIADDNDNISYCDIYNKIKDNFNATDGLHYYRDTYKNIYNLMIGCI